MLGGEEINALVADFGTFWTKAGYAGDDLPKAVFNTHCGSISDSNDMDIEIDHSASKDKRKQKKHVFGINDLSFPRRNMEIVNPYKEGLVHDFDLASQLWRHTFVSRLRVDPKEFAVLYGEPAWTPRLHREKITELFFEDFEVPAFFFSKSAVLSMFSVGKSSGLVIDAGYQSTSTTPVHDGYALQRALNRSPVGFEVLQDEYMRFIQQNLEQAKSAQTPTENSWDIVPLYKIKKKVEVGVGDVMCELQEGLGETRSYKEFMQKLVLRDAMETHFRVSETAYTEEAFANAPFSGYELPDGKKLHVGPEKVRIPDLLFNPAPLQDHSTFAQNKLFGLADMLFDSVGKCDQDVRRELFSSLVICGGASLLTGFTERLTREINEKPVTQMYKMKLLTPLMNEKKFSSWIGGSILGSLGTFHQMWVSRQEVLEAGTAVVHKKCP